MRCLFPYSVALVATLLASHSWAQERARPERPYRGVFGGGVGNAEQLLEVRASLGAGTADDQGPSSGRGASPQGDALTVHGQGASDVSYAFRGRTFGLRASTGASMRYRPDTRSVIVGSKSGGAGASWQPTTRTSVQADQTVTWTPYAFLPTFAAVSPDALGEGPTINEDLATTLRDTRMYAGSASIEQKFGRRASLTAVYRYNLNEQPAADDQLLVHNLMVSWSYTLAKGLALRLGVNQTLAASKENPSDDADSSRVFDGGLDINRALSFSRRATVSFSTGSIATKAHGTRATDYNLTARGNFNYEIGRGWNAALAYDRGLRFVDRFEAPVFSDTVTVQVGGLVTRRIDMRAMASAVGGHAGVADTAKNPYRSYQGMASINVALNRHLAFGGAYTYYSHAFQTSMYLPSDTALRSGRHGVQVMMSVWAPLLHRAQRPNASR